jgi:7-keto-8-aminopelargonate synthetase-like enzyme
MGGGRHEIGASSASSPTALVLDGRSLLSFGGCNYLGLAHHPSVIAALTSGLEGFGISSGASRETTGNSSAHVALEADAAGFLGCEAALLTPDGYLANLVIAQGLAPNYDLALVDAQSHASIRDALAASGLHVVPYEHTSAESAARLLAECERDARREAKRASSSGSGTFRPLRARNDGLGVAIFTDGVFPSQKSIAPLHELLALLPRERGVLVVDDCHSTGVLGDSGRGTSEHLGVSDPRIVITTTLSKAFGCFGGLIAGSRAMIDAARAHSRAYVCSSPIPPALALAGSASIRELNRDLGRLRRLRDNIARLRKHFSKLGLPTPAFDIPVFAFTLDSVERMEHVYTGLFESGVLAPYIRYPDGMDDRRGYFRIALCAEHTSTDIDRLATELERQLRT